MSQQQWNVQRPQAAPGHQGPQLPRYQGGPQPSAVEAPPVNKDDNAFAALFDFSFRRYATPGVVKVIFGLFAGIVALAMLFFVARGVIMVIGGHDVLLGIVFILGGVLVSFLVLLLIRVLLELAVATVRMSRNTAELRDDVKEIKQLLRTRPTSSG